MAYFESIADYRNGYLLTSPRKRDVIQNAKIDGVVSILPDSNNRAVVIETDREKVLQSYDTLILSVEKTTGKIHKLWNGYSVTTLKHINEFLRPYCMSFNKKEWQNFK